VTVFVRAAGEDDVDDVMQLVARCIDAMRREGIEQWDDVYPDRQTILSDAREGTLYVGSFEAAGLAGTLAINDYQNPEYAQVHWTISPARVAVVHRLMIDPRHQGRGIARELMRFAEELARGRGYDAVRLDAFSENPRALRLYQRLGYHDAGTVTFRKGKFHCFEKALAS
jgi:ribosomal protein S18 acetylase RimI-like enzyme